MMLSDRSKQPIKVALAVVIAYGIALSMDWQKPYWSGYGVVLISLVTSGQSMQKGVLRITGAVCGALAGLVLVATFVQDRWMFIAAMSTFGAACAYLRLGAGRFDYFWLQVAYVGTVVAIAGWQTPETAFHTGLERMLESTTGVLVFTVIDLLLWPHNSLQPLENAASRLISSMHQWFQVISTTLRGASDEQTAGGFHAQVTALQSQFGTLLDGAMLVSMEVSRTGAAWRRSQRLLIDTCSTLDRCETILGDLRGIRLEAHLPELTAILGEMEQRLLGIERMLP